MNKTFDVPRDPRFAKSALKVREQGMKYLENGVREILDRKIQEVYYVNIRLAPWRIVVPINEMLKSYTISYTTSPMSMTIMIDESKIIWSEKYAEKLHGKRSHAYYGFGDDNFATRIPRPNEDSKFFDVVYAEIANFVNKNFVSAFIGMIK